MKTSFRFFLKGWMAAVISIVLFTTAASAQIYYYSNATTGAPATVAPNVTGSSITRVNGAVAPGSPCASGFSSTNFTAATTYSTTLPAINVDATPAAGFQLNVTGFSVGLRRSGTGPASARLAYSTDGGTTWIDQLLTVSPNNAGCGTVTTCTWTLPSTVVATSLFKFRVFFWGASGTSGTEQILNLYINGSATAAGTPCVAPNPATAFQFTIVNTSQTNISYTASTGSADGYLVIASPSVTLSAGPVNGVAYAVGTSLGGGTVIYNGTATTASATGLNPALDYHYFIYAYKSVACTGGPAYATVLTGVDSLPLPVITQDPVNDTACAGTTAAFAAMATNAISYQWQEFNGVWTNLTNSGIYSGANTNALSLSPVATTLTGRSYRLIAYNLNGQADTSAPAKLTVNPTPSAAISPNGTVSFCQGSTLTLNAPIGPGLQYQWLLSGTPVAGAISDTLHTTIAGSYAVMVTDAYGCTQTGVAVSTVPVMHSANVNAFTSTTFCSGDSVVLHANTGVGFTYQWLLGGAAIASATTDTFVATTTNSYAVVITNSIGCIDTSAATSVTANAPPVATISTVMPTNFCQGDSAVLNAGAAIGVIYQWLLNAAPIAAANSASFIAKDAGAYTVKVGTTSTCYSISPALNVVVHALPSAFFITTGAPTFCSGDSTKLIAGNTTAASYHWQLNNANISAANADSLTVYTPGQYTVRITDNFGCAQTSAPLGITVNPLPAAQVIPGGNIAFCMGDSLVLNANAGAGLSYQWYRNASALGIISNNYKAGTNGTYTVRVTDANGCSQLSSATNITVNPLPLVAATLSGPATFCQGNSVVITTTPSAGQQYQWKQNGTTIAAATGNTYTAAASGAYSVVVTIATTGCKDSTAPVAITVNPLPQAVLTAASALTFCSGDSVMLQATTGAGLSYQWFVNGLPVAGASAGTFAAKTTGSYTVNVTNANNCTAISNSINVTANPAPDTYITYASPLSFCAGGAVVLTASNTGNINYQWYKDGQLQPGVTSYSNIVSQTGAYTVREVNIFGCTGNSAAVPVVVFTAPAPVITINGFTLSTGTFASYQWWKNNVSIGGATAPNYIATANGAYKVTITDVNGCEGTSDTRFINTVAVTAIKGDNAIRIFPQPAQDMLYIQAPYKVRVALYDMQGHLLMQVQDAREMDIRTLPAGMYLLRISDKKGQLVQVNRVTKI